MVTDLTQGSIKKHYIKYLGASLGSALISCVYGLIDAAVVGQYQGPSGSSATAQLYSSSICSAKWIG